MNVYTSFITEGENIIHSICEPSKNISSIIVYPCMGIGLRQNGDSQEINSCKQHSLTGSSINKKLILYLYS